jgi:hypothetical protein
VKDGVHIRQLTVVGDRGTSLEMSDGIESDDRVIVNPPVDIGQGQDGQAAPVAAPKA